MSEREHREARAGGDFDDLLAAALAGEAADGRARARWLRQQASEDTSLVGLLRRLVVEGAPVAVRTGTGRVHRGVVVRAAADHCSLRTGGAVVHIPLPAVVTVEAHRLLHEVPLADADDVVFRDVVADALAAQVEVRLGALGWHEQLAGELVAVGADVLAVRTSTAVTYVRLASVAELSVPDLPSG